MHRPELVDVAIRVAGAFPAVTRGQPFGEGAEVFKVAGKVFAIVDTAPDAAAAVPAPAKAGAQARAQGGAQARAQARAQAPDAGGDADRERPPAQAAAAASGALPSRSPSVVTLKCAPPHARALVAEHVSIIPGYHMNKEHWISLCPGDDLDETTVEDLIGNSYDIVVSLLPRARRPAAAPTP